MIELVQSLIALLERDSLSVEAVVARVGGVKEDPGVPLPIVLRPRLAGVKAAKLSRYPDSSLPYTLELRLSPAAQPTAAALKAALGEYRRSRTDMGMPREIVFTSPAGGAKWKLAVIAELAPSPAELDAAKVTTITLRRDPR